MVSPIFPSIDEPTLHVNGGIQVGVYSRDGLPTTNPVTLNINKVSNKVSVKPTFAGLSGAGLYQINLTVPSGLGAGEVSLQATVGGVETPDAVFSLQ
jgi:uncharacterized protein (TIGR03437 family)